MKIFSGNANPVLTRRMADYIGQPLGEVRLSRFPDGEIFVQIIENIRGSDVFIVQPTSYPPNDNLMELLIMIDAARRASAARITAVVPFFGYARQDRKDRPRAPITAKLVANLLVAAGANRILTVDLHAQQIQGFFDIPVDHLYAAPVIIDCLRRKKLGDEMVIVSPDAGGLKMAYAYARGMACGLALVAKHRKSSDKVEASNLVGEVEGKPAVLVDDMTSTAGTMCEAARLLKEHGAISIHAAVSHSLLNEQGLNRLKESPIEELITTDSIPQPDYHGFPVTVLSIAELLGKAVIRIHNNQSVSSLLQLK